MPGPTTSGWMWKYRSHILIIGTIKGGTTDDMMIASTCSMRMF